MNKASIKYLFVLLIVICSTACSDDNEPDNGNVYLGNVFISNQAELDEFVELGVTRINGDLIIAPISQNETVNISDLRPLSGLDTINGSLIIRSTNGLTNLNGFENIRRLTGSLLVEFNEDLQNINGVDNLSSAFAIQILNNPVLQNIDALQNLDDVTNLLVSDNDQLAQLTNFASLDDLRILVISGNPQLNSLSGLENLQSCREILSILRSPLLQNLTGLDNLQEVGLLDIGENQALTDLTALSRMTSLGALSITRNTVLSSLNGLQNIEAIEQGSLDIWDNPELESISGLGEELAFIGLPGWTTSQSASIRIGGNPKLADLNSIRFRGALFNQLEFWDMPSATALPKFEADIAISGLRVENLEMIENLAPMASVDGFIQDLTITLNDALLNLDGLSGINSISGNFNVSNNEALTDFCGISDGVLQEVYQSYLVVRNAYNPTIDDFKDGNCSN